MARRMVARIVSRQSSITSDHVDARKENIKRALRAQRSPPSRCCTRPDDDAFERAIPSLPSSTYGQPNTRAIYTRIRKVFSIFFLPLRLFRGESDKNATRKVSSRLKFLSSILSHSYIFSFLLSLLRLIMKLAGKHNRREHEINTRKDNENHSP